MKALVTGAAGQLGADVADRLAASGHEVVAASRRDLDITRRDQVLGAVGAVRPDAVVNCAAYTAVDSCETDADRAFAVNALAVRHLAEAARRFDAHLCHLSTDYVFSGDKPEPYHEWDRPDPRSVYGASKLAGEQEAGEAATVVRTSWLCGRHGANMVGTVLRLAAEDAPMRFVTDQRGSPSFTPDALPAVTVPPSRNGVGSLASPSSVVCGRGCSSCSTVTGSPLRRGTMTGVISLASRPSSIAAAARRWLR